MYLVDNIQKMVRIQLMLLQLHLEQLNLLTKKADNENKQKVKEAF